jgi:diguanylate cyclase (GGDEF)-like protein
MQPPRPSRARWSSWLFAAGMAGAFFLALSGVVVRHLTGVPAVRVYGAVGFFMALLACFALYGEALKRHSFLVSLSVPILLSLMTQWTGGWASPLSGFLFPLVALWAWFLGLRHAMAGAAMFIFLAIMSERGDLPAGPYLAAWICSLVLFLTLLKKVEEIRRQKERFQGKLERLHEEAKQLAVSSEPASFQATSERQVLKDKNLGARMSSVMGLEGALLRHLDLIRRSLDAHTAACFLLAQLGDKPVLRLRGAVSSCRDILPDTVIPFGESLVGLTAKERRKVLVDPLSAESAKTLPYYSRPQNVQSFLAIPVFLHAAEGEEPELAGVLLVDDVRAGHFDEHRTALAESFAAQVAETIQAVRVLHFSGAKTRNLDALYQASQAFSTLLDEEQVVQTTLETAVAMFDTDASMVALASLENGAVVVRAGTGSHRAGKTLEGMDGELAHFVMEKRKPIRYSKGMRGETAGMFQRRDPLWGGIQSCLMVPLSAGAQSLGVVRLDNRQADAFQEFDQEVLQTLANQAGLALENARRVRQVQELAVRDGLTGLHNHRYFQERLGEELIKADRYHKDLCLILMDVDHFKKFNDQYGHPEGDRILKAVADALARSVRNKIDTVARYGGEEFVALLPETSIQSGRELAERIRQKVESMILPKREGEGVFRVTLSLGVAAFPFDAREQGPLIQRADEALYHSKAAGRNKVSVYNAQLSKQTPKTPT